MPNILQILAERQRRQRDTNQQRLVSAVIIRGGFGRYEVNDGSQAVECETILREQLKPGQRVWITRGRGVNVIVGLHGTDLAVEENA